MKASTRVVEPAVVGTASRWVGASACSFICPGFLHRKHPVHAAIQSGSCQSSAAVAAAVALTTSIREHFYTPFCVGSEAHANGAAGWQSGAAVHVGSIGHHGGSFPLEHPAVTCVCLKQGCNLDIYISSRPLRRPVELGLIFRARDESSIQRYVCKFSPSKAAQGLPISAPGHLWSRFASFAACCSTS